MRHELTQKVWEAQVSFSEHDKVIRTWLEEKVNELNWKVNELKWIVCDKTKLERILGLQEMEKESAFKGLGKGYPRTACDKGHGKEWPCKHIFKWSKEKIGGQAAFMEGWITFDAGINSFTQVPNYVDHCYYCLSKRPEKREKELWEVIRAEFHNQWPNDNLSPPTGNGWPSVEKVALDWVRENRDKL